MPPSDQNEHALRVADLKTSRPTKFEFRPNEKACQEIASELDLLGLRKLSFVGQVAAQGKSDWVLTAKLGATVVQKCVVTLNPVKTRIDLPIRRLFLANIDQPIGEEVEMPEDDSQDPLGEFIDPYAVMIESLSLSLPDYPRADESELATAQFTEPGKVAMTDEDLKPFAGLAELRDQLAKKEKNE